jgi:hypothetical protein
MRFLLNWQKKAKTVIKVIENKDWPYFYLGVYFYSVCITRGLLERLLEAAHELPEPTHLFLHWPLWYFNFLITIIFILSFFTKERIEKVTKVAVVFSFLIISVPIIDFLVSGGRGYVLGYAMSVKEVVSLMLSAGGILRSSIMSPGQSVLVWILISLTFVYIKQKSGSLGKAFFGVVAWYFVGIFYASFPFALASLFGLKPIFSNQLMQLTIYFLALLGLVQIIIWKYVHGKQSEKYSF